MIYKISTSGMMTVFYLVQAESLTEAIDKTVKFGITKDMMLEIIQCPSYTIIHDKK